MGGNSSKEEPDPHGDQSNQVDIELIDQQIRELFTFKILLLGAGESGKSTIVKQLKLIHKKKMDDKEPEQIGNSLHQNVVDCMKSLLTAVRTFGEHELPDECKETEDMLNNRQESERLTQDQGDMIHALWESEAIQHAYSRRNEFWLLDSFDYYIKHLDRFCEPNFVPNDEDCVMARIRTTGIVVTELESRIAKDAPDEPDNLLFQVVDVGGQRNERKKWIHCFDDVRAILFISNLAGYDQVLFEDATKNRMVESLDLFEKVCNNANFKNTPIFLFLNKKDLFEKMCLKRSIGETFADYTGETELRPQLDFVTDLFRARLKNKEVQVEEVSARARRDIRGAFDEVKKELYEKNRKELLKQVGELNKQKRQKLAEAAKRANGKGGCCTIM